MSWSTDGGPERLGRRLGRAFVRGRVVARQLDGPGMRARLANSGRKAAVLIQPKVQEAAGRARQEFAARGPDAAEQVAQRAVDRIFSWGLGGRTGLLVSALRPLAQPARTAAGTLARDLAKAAGAGVPPATSTTDTRARALSPPPNGPDARSGRSEPPTL